jgi:group I intron endonuclease
MFNLSHLILYKGKIVVYGICRRSTNEWYIGSTINIVKRANMHLQYLINNKHHSIFLQRVWNKYGADEFFIIILKVCTEKTRFKWEQYYIDKFNSTLNARKIATFISAWDHTEETKKLYSETRKGKRYLPIGFRHSIETRRRLSEINSAWPTYGFLGKKHSQETKLKLSAISKRQIPNRLGAKRSRETILKIRQKSLLNNMRGVSITPAGNYKVAISVDGKLKQLGTYYSVNIAIQVRRNAENLYWQ